MKCAMSLGPRALKAVCATVLAGTIVALVALGGEEIVLRGLDIAAGFLPRGEP